MSRSTNICAFTYHVGLAIKRSKAPEGIEKKKVGRKRIARPVGYRKQIKIEDPDNPNTRKLYSKD